MRFRYFVFSFIPLFLILFTAEIGLRIADFRYSDTPLQVRLENKDYNIQRSLPEAIGVQSSSELLKDGDIVKDRYQFWVPKHDPIRGRYSVTKPAGVRRIAALGCSCTWGCYQTQESYPSILEKLLNLEGAQKYEVLNAGVGSYSSYQGLQRLKRYVLNYQPDIVTIFFGWNDHWFAQNDDKNIRMRGDFEIFIVNILEKFRAYQAAHYLFRKVLGAFQGKPVGQKQFVFRVSPEDYRANLKEMIRAVRERGAQAVLFTAPYEPSQLKASWVFPLPSEQLANVHENFNQVVRKLAAETQTPLIDLSMEVKVLRDADPVRAAELFSDGIHYTPFGCETVAKLIYVNLKKLGLI